MLDPSWYPVSALQISADSIGSLSILRNRYTFAGSSIHKMASWFQLIQIQIDFRMISLDDLVRSQLADASGNCHWPHVQCATQWLSYHRCGHQLQWPVTTQEKTCHERSTVKLVAVFCELWLGMRTLVLQWWCISTGMTSNLDHGFTGENFFCFLMENTWKYTISGISGCFLLDIPDIPFKSEEMLVDQPRRWSCEQSTAAAAFAWRCWRQQDLPCFGEAPVGLVSTGEELLRSRVSPKK